MTEPPHKHQPRKRPAQARSRFTVDAILTATERVLGSRGLEQTSTTAVAELAGVSVGTLYQYFPNKQALVAAVIEARVERDLEALRQAFAEIGALPLPAALDRLGLVLASLYGDEPELYRELVAALDPLERGRRVEALIDETIVGVAELLQAKADEHGHDQPEVAAWIYVQTGVQMLRTAARERPQWVADGTLFRELRVMTARYLGLDAE